MVHTASNWSRKIKVGVSQTKYFRKENVKCVLEISSQTRLGLTVYQLYDMTITTQNKVMSSTPTQESANQHNSWVKMEYVLSVQVQP